MADGRITSSPEVEGGSFTSADVDHARAILHRFYYPTAIGTPEGAEGFRLDMQVIKLGPLTLGELCFGVPITLAASGLDAYHIAMPTVGCMLARHAGHEVTAGPSTGVVFGPAGPVFALHEACSAELAVKIERAALERELATLLDRPVDGPIDLPATLDLSDGPGLSWRRLVHLLRDELTHAESLIRNPLIAERLRHSVLSGLLLSAPHRYHDELVAPAPAGPPRAIRQVLDAIHDEPERPFTVATLAALAGVSVRSLQEGFRRHVGRSPMAYLQQVRLERAHTALLAADPARTTVAAIAHRWGFAHQGRFSALYRAHFGQFPSETLRAPR
jgi:AraC-like DNA-binding protein